MRKLSVTRLIRYASSKDFRLRNDTVAVLLDRVAAMPLGEIIFEQGHPLHKDGYMKYMRGGFDDDPSDMWKTRCRNMFRLLHQARDCPAIEELFGDTQKRIYIDGMYSLLEVPLTQILDVLADEDAVKDIHFDARFILSLLRAEDMNPDEMTYADAIDHFLGKPGRPGTTDYRACRILMYKFFMERNNA